MNTLLRLKVVIQFISSNLELLQEDLQLGHLHQLPQVEDILQLKLQEWEMTGQLVMVKTDLKKLLNTVDTTRKCTNMNQATNGLTHTMILMIKCSISETELSCLQIETQEKWLLLRLIIPMDNTGLIQEA